MYARMGAEKQCGWWCHDGFIIGSSSFTLGQHPQCQCSHLIKIQIFFFIQLKYLRHCWSDLQCSKDKGHPPAPYCALKLLCHATSDSNYPSLWLIHPRQCFFFKGAMMRKERIGAVTCSKTLSSLFAANRESGNYFRLPRVCLNNAII